MFSPGATKSGFINHSGLTTPRPEKADKLLFKKL
jgi:hypothetical protein